MIELDKLVVKSYYISSTNPIGSYIQDLYRIANNSMVGEELKLAVKEEVDRVAAIVDGYKEVEYDKIFKIKKLVPPDRLKDKDS